MPSLFPHIEDGTLLDEFGQRFRCAGLKGIHIRLGDDLIFPQKVELCAVLLKAHDLPPKMRRHAGRVLPLPDLTQQIEIMHIEGKEAGVFRMRQVWPIFRP